MIIRENLQNPEEGQYIVQLDIEEQVVVANAVNSLLNNRRFQDQATEEDIDAASERVLGLVSDDSSAEDDSLPEAAVSFDTINYLWNALGAYQSSIYNSPQSRLEIMRAQRLKKQPKLDTRAERLAHQLCEGVETIKRGDGPYSTDPNYQPISSQDSLTDKILATV